MSFLCTACRQLMCQDCKDIADEYHELERNRAQAQALAESRVEDLQRELEQVQRNAAMWEELAKAGFPEVIQRWMDSLSANPQAAEQVVAPDTARCVCDKCGQAHDPKLVTGGVGQNPPRR